MKRDSRRLMGLGSVIALAAVMLALVVISGMFLVRESGIALQPPLPFQFAAPAPEGMPSPQLAHTEQLHGKRTHVARNAHPHRSKKA